MAEPATVFTRIVRLSGAAHNAYSLVAWMPGNVAFGTGEAVT